MVLLWDGTGERCVFFVVSVDLFGVRMEWGGKFVVDMEKLRGKHDMMKIVLLTGGMSVRRRYERM